MSKTPFLTGLIVLAGLGAGWMTRPKAQVGGSAANQEEVTSHGAVSETGSPQRNLWSELAGVLREADAAQCEAAYRQLLEEDWHVDRTYQIEAWMRRWLELDPKTAIAYVRSAESEAWHTLERTLTLWSMMDGAAAYQYAKKRLGQEDRERMLRAFVASDPEGAAALAKEDGDFKRNAGSIEYYRFYRMAQVDPSGTIDHALAAGSAAIRGVFDAWMESDPEAALTWAMTQLDTPHANVAAFTLYKATKGEALQAAIKEVRGRRHEALAEQFEFVRAWQVIDPKAAASWFGSQPFGKETSVEDIMNRLNRMMSPKATSSIDPEFVLAFARIVASRDGATSFQSLKVVAQALGQMAEQDFPKAKRWLETMPIGLMDEGLLKAFGRGWARHDGAAAARWASGLNSSYTRSAVANAWASSDPQAALEWLQRQPEEVERENTRQMIAVFAESDMEIAKQLAEENLLGPGLVSTVLSKWPSASLDEAARWLAGLPEEDRSSNFEGLARRWAIQDSEMASTWVSGLHEGPERDFAVKGLVEVLIAHSDPDFGAALTWAQSIQGESAQVVLGEVAYWWAERDPKAAVEAVATLKRDEELVAPLYQTVVRAWTYMNSAEAEASLESFDGLARDHAIDGFTTALVHSKSHRHWHQSQIEHQPQIERALAWAQRIRDPALRLKSLSQVLEVLPEEDIVAWIKGAALVHENRAQLLDKFAPQADEL